MEVEADVKVDVGGKEVDVEVYEGGYRYGCGLKSRRR